MAETAESYCVNHRRRTTLITCSTCSDPICPDCMVYTPVGIKCRRCGTTRHPLYKTGAGTSSQSGLLFVVIVFGFVLLSRLIAPSNQRLPGEQQSVRTIKSAQETQAPSSEEKPSVEWVDERISRDSQGYFLVTGKVRNASNKTLNLKIWAFFRDEAQQVVEKSQPLVFENTQAGEEKIFLFKNESLQNSLRIKRFSLQAEFRAEAY